MRSGAGTDTVWDTMRTSDDVPSGPGFGLHAVPIWRPWHERLKRLFAQHQHVTSRQERDALNSHFAETLIEEAREVSEEFSRNNHASSSEQSRPGVNAAQLNGLALLAVATMFDMALAQQSAPQVRSLLACDSGPLANEDAAMASAWQMFMLQASSSLGLTPTLSAAPAPDGSIRKLPSFESPKSPSRRFGSMASNASMGSNGSVTNLGSPTMGSRRDGTMPRNTSELFMFEQ